MDIFPFGLDTDWQMTDEELGLTPAARYRQQQHEAKERRRRVMSKIRARRR